MFSKMFDKRTGILISAFCCASCFGVLTCELQGVGSVVSAITGSPIALGVLIGGVIGLLYVIFGGMEQVGWVNVFNAIFMYVGVFIAILYLNGVIDGGWVSVNEYYISNGRAVEAGAVLQRRDLACIHHWHSGCRHVQTRWSPASPVRSPHLPEALRPSAVLPCMLFP